MRPHGKKFNNGDFKHHIAHQKETKIRASLNYEKALHNIFVSKGLKYQAFLKKSLLYSELNQGDIKYQYDQ